MIWGVKNKIFNVDLFFLESDQDSKKFKEGKRTVLLRNCFLVLLMILYMTRSETREADAVIEHSLGFFSDLMQPDKYLRDNNGYVSKRLAI